MRFGSNSRATTTILFFVDIFERDLASLIALLQRGTTDMLFGFSVIWFLVADFLLDGAVGAFSE